MRGSPNRRAAPPGAGRLGAGGLGRTGARPGASDRDATRTAPPLRWAPCPRAARSSPARRGAGARPPEAEPLREREESAADDRPLRPLSTPAPPEPRAARSASREAEPLRPPSPPARGPLPEAGPGRRGAVGPERRVSSAASSQPTLSALRAARPDSPRGGRG
ncbi:hypothetical protein [Streptacidiphilus jiangxiensis]|uniref:hypothetical protein n=1 Tax=Streptacidiphilus jiangxiensis TaxID=235985 RepID=UPI001FCFD363|nr:hypothetical protein [Streptacidiphilus jiangxiensis]